MTNERMRQFALCWEVAAAYVTKRFLHLAEIHDIEKKTGRLESERIPDTSNKSTTPVLEYHAAGIRG